LKLGEIAMKIGIICAGDRELAPFYRIFKIVHNGAEHFDKNIIAASKISKNIVIELLKEI